MHDEIKASFERVPTKTELGSRDKNGVVEALEEVIVPAIEVETGAIVETS